MVAGKPFPQKNEGHSGWTIEPGGGSPGGISSLVPSPAFTTMPDIVLLMIGTNDAGKSLTAQQMADNLGKLIDSVISTAPNALLVVSGIPPLSNQQAKVDSYNEKIPGLVQTRAAAGKHVLAVANKLTAADMTGDNVHPNAGGYEKLGDSWYEVIKGYLRTGT
jgi:lysophospholipase L1-like esterase